jgi:hypothetical protein
MPEAQREWGDAMLAELDEVAGTFERWRFAMGCARVALFPPVFSTGWRSALDAIRRLSPGYGLMSVLLPLLGLPLLCLATIVIGSLEQRNGLHDSAVLMATNIGVVLIVGCTFIASGFPCGILGLARRERCRWLSLTGPIFSASVVTYLFLVSLLVGHARLSAREIDRSRAPEPQEAVGAILKLFETKQIVALADLHGCAQELAFLEQLVTAPEFLSTVNVLTWELGNSRYQSVMDDYIVNGVAIPFSELRKCWRENTQPNLLGDTPRLVELLSRIRDANLTVEKARKLRVVLIDPPVDWSEIEGPADLRPELFDRDAHIARVLEEEVYSKGRKALFFAGHAHLLRTRQETGITELPESTEPKPQRIPVSGTALDRLESEHPGTISSIWVHIAPLDDTSKLARAMRTWPRPSLAPIRGTWYEQLRPPALMKKRAPVLMAQKQSPGSASAPTPLPPGGPPPGEENSLRHWDAVLFLGMRGELTRAPTVSEDQLGAEWMTELRRRQRLLNLPEVNVVGSDAEEPYFPLPARER